MTINEALEITLINLNYAILTYEDKGEIDEANRLYDAYLTIRDALIKERVKSNGK